MFRLTNLQSNKYVIRSSVWELDQNLPLKLIFFLNSLKKELKIRKKLNQEIKSKSAIEIDFFSALLGTKEK